MTLRRTVEDFVAQDDRVTDVDQDVNVHDLQRWYKNLNSLAGRRARQPSIVIGSSSAVGAGIDIDEPFNIYGWAPSLYVAGPSASSKLGPWPIGIPPWAREVTFKVRAALTDANQHVFLYPQLSWGPQPQVNTDVAIDIDNASADDFEIDVPIRGGYQWQAGAPAWFTCYVLSQLDVAGGAGHRVGTITSVGVGENYVDVDTDPGAAYALIQDVDKASVPIVQSAGYEPITVDGATYYRVRLLNSWLVRPDPGDEIAFYSMGVAAVTGMSVQAKRVSSFDTTHPAGA